MVVIEIDRGLLLALLWIARGKLLIEEVGRDVVDVDEVYARLFYDLTIPAAIAVVAALDMPIRPLVAGRQ